MSRPDLETLLRGAPPLTRFAPSPTGYLHLGHIVNAIYVWGVAQALEGDVLVRLEDHDRIRSRAAFADALVEDLVWLGFRHAHDAVIRQHDRHDLYSDALERLRRVAHVYACDCSRASFDGERYPGTCRGRGLAETAGRSLRVQIEPGIETAHDLRLGTLHQAPEQQCGDIVIRDRDRHWTYQFAVTVDDTLQRVSLVVRGEDILSSTGRQVQLGRLLRRAGLGDRHWPPVYLHHPLILDDDGAKLSKSSGAAGVRHLRTTGVTPEEVIGRAAAAIGLIDAPRAIAARDVGRLMGSVLPLRRLAPETRR